MHRRRQRPRHHLLSSTPAALVLGLAILLLSTAVVMAIATLVPASAAPAQRDATPSTTATPGPEATATASGFRIVLPGVRTSDPTPTPTPSPTPSPTPPVTPTPTPEPVPAGFTQLQRDLAAMIDGHPGPTQLAIAVTDLQTGQAIHVNGNRPRLSGCVMNLYVLIDAIREAQYGQLNLDDIRALVYATTWSSNAVTAFHLYGITGGGRPIEGTSRAADIHDQLELSDGTIIDHPPGFPGYSRGINANNYVTALDVNRTLAGIYHREILDDAHTRFLLGAMGQVKPGLNYLTAAGVPSWVTVNHKNGFFPSASGYVDNDAGIVRFERDGREYAYAVTFLSQQNPEKYSQLPLARRMMSRTWDYFDATY